MPAVLHAAAAAAQKPEKQRQVFWRGQVVLHLPDMGVTNQPVAEVRRGSRWHGPLLLPHQGGTGAGLCTALCVGSYS